MQISEIKSQKQICNRYLFPVVLFLRKYFVLLSNLVTLIPIVTNFKFITIKNFQFRKSESILNWF